MQGLYDEEQLTFVGLDEVKFVVLPAHHYDLLHSSLLVDLLPLSSVSLVMSEDTDLRLRLNDKALLSVSLLVLSQLVQVVQRLNLDNL